MKDMDPLNRIHESFWELDRQNSPRRQYLYRFRPFHADRIDSEIIQNSHWHSHLDDLGDIFEVKNLLPKLPPPGIRDVSAVAPFLHDLKSEDVKSFLVSTDEYIQQISKPQTLPYFHTAAAGARYLGDEHLLKGFIYELFSITDIETRAFGVLTRQVEILAKYLKIFSAVCCFTEDPCSMMMWDFYGGGSRGYCIGYVCGSALLNPNTIHPIKYEKDFSRFTHEEISRRDFSIFDILLKKDARYSGEKEWRTIQYREGLYESLFPICEITLGARMKDRDAELVLAAAQTLPVKPRLYRAKRSTRGGIARITRKRIDLDRQTQIAKRRRDR